VAAALRGRRKIGAGTRLGQGPPSRADAELRDLVTRLADEQWSCLPSTHRTRMVPMRNGAARPGAGLGAPQAGERNRETAAMTGSAVPDPAAILLRIAGGMRATQALHAAAALDIAGLLADGPRDGTVLAAACGADPGALRRLMRCLTALGIFAEPEPGHFALTAISGRLRADAPRSLRPAVLWMASDLRWRCWGNLLHSLRTGEPASAPIVGPDVFAWYADHPEDAALHTGAMAIFASAVSAAVIEAYDFTRFARIMDVGGGTGEFLAEVLAATPGLTGVLFDMPHVVAEAPPLLAARGVAGRCDVVGGSFFDAVPGGADVCLLKQVIHDWDDDRAAAVLETCRAALTPDGTLLILERVMPERADGQPPDPFLLDMEMLVMTPGGRERTEGEFRTLLSRAGLAVRRIVGTTLAVSVIEATRA
jgi:SAM-dependent methyltransferase